MGNGTVKKSATGCDPALEREAECQHASVAQVLTQAVFVYLAASLAERVLEIEDRDAGPRSQSLPPDHPSTIAETHTAAQDYDDVTVDDPFSPSPRKASAQPSAPEG